MKTLLSEIPIKPQRQDSVSEQLADLQVVAIRLGMYDAVDAIKQWCNGLPELKYGCHCDLEIGEVPNACVIDEGFPHFCVYAKPNMRKEQCVYWRIIK